VPRVTPHPTEDYLPVPLTADERQRLIEFAHANERDAVGQIRWQIRAIIRPENREAAPCDAQEAAEVITSTNRNRREA
jgi:hypothetical protein